MKKKKEETGPVVVETYEDEIEFTCPVRGKIKQKVLVKRLASVEASQVEETLPSKSLTDKLDQKFSGLLVEDDSLEDEGELQQEEIE